MSHATLISEVEDWLLMKALADPDIRQLFENLCNRIQLIDEDHVATWLKWTGEPELLQAAMNERIPAAIS